MMPKNRNSKSAILAALCVLGMSPHAFAGDGSATSGGGHGVRLQGGGTTLLDLVDDPAQVNRVEFNPFTHASTRVYVKDALERIRDLESRFPAFARQWITAFEEMKWFFTSSPLPMVDDHGTTTPGLFQLANQDENGNVTIVQTEFNNVNVPNAKSALFLHESALAKLGLNFPRKTLKQILKAMYSNDPKRFDTIQMYFDSVSSVILKGEREIAINILGDIDQGKMIQINVAAYTNGVAGSLENFHSKGKTYARIELSELFRSGLIGVNIADEWCRYGDSKKYEVYVNNVLRLSARLEGDTPSCIAIEQLMVR